MNVVSQWSGESFQKLLFWWQEQGNMFSKPSLETCTDKFGKSLHKASSPNHKLVLY